MHEDLLLWWYGTRRYLCCHATWQALGFLIFFRIHYVPCFVVATDDMVGQLGNAYASMEDAYNPGSVAFLDTKAQFFLCVASGCQLWICVPGAGSCFEGVISYLGILRTNFIGTVFLP